MNEILSNDWLRPSTLPKLARCGHFRSEPDAGLAAARGGQLDTVFRALIAGENISAAELDPEDREAVRWAVDTVRALSGGYALESREEYLRISALGLSGTADLLCAGAGWSADLKTGQRHNYLEQQAAYALGFMDDCFADEWTTYLVYCDLREVEARRFTRTEAEKIVRTALATARGEEPPAVNEFCGWCCKRFDCAARKESIGVVPLADARSLSIETAESPLLREFVLRAGIVEEFAEKAREILKSRCLAGERIPGVSLVSKRGSRRIDASALAPLIDKVGSVEILSALGTVTESRAQELWIGSSIEAPFPTESVEELPGSTFVRIGHPRR
jgi:hypothetical protein